MVAADTRSLEYLRRGEPAALITGPAWPGDFGAFRRREPIRALASGMARTITAAGAIGSAEAFGAPGLLNVTVLTPVAIDTGEAVGSPGLAATSTISGVGAIGSGERFGSAVDPGKMATFRRREPAGFLLSNTSNAGLDHFRRGDLMAGMPPYGQSGGAPVELRSVAYVSAVGAIVTREAFGTPKIAGPISAAGGIASREAFGLPVVAITSGPRHRPIAASVSRLRQAAGTVAR